MSGKIPDAWHLLLSSLLFIRVIAVKRSTTIHIGWIWAVQTGTWTRKVNYYSCKPVVDNRWETIRWDTWVTVPKISSFHTESTFYVLASGDRRHTHGAAWTGWYLGTIDGGNACKNLDHIAGLLSSFSPPNSGDSLSYLCMRGDMNLLHVVQSAVQEECRRWEREGEETVRAMCQNCTLRVHLDIIVVRHRREEEENKDNYNWDIQGGQIKWIPPIPHLPTSTRLMKRIMSIQRPCFKPIIRYKCSIMLILLFNLNSRHLPDLRRLKVPLRHYESVWGRHLVLCVVPSRGNRAHSFHDYAVV